MDFQDQHMFFKLIENETQKIWGNGFSVRRYQDALYVTAVGQEERVQPGDRIISLDNIPIPELVVKHQRDFMEDVAERERWKDVIAKYSSCEVIRSDGSKRTIELKKYEKDPYVPEHSIKQVPEDTLCMTLTDFFSPDDVNELLEKHQRLLNVTENLIVDVRFNRGGTDAAFEALASHLFPEEPMTIGLADDYMLTFNCTKRNCELQVNTLKESIEKTDDENIQHMLRDIIQAWEKNKGKGFVAFDESNERTPITGKENPKNIIVLSDVYCGSAGDIFVHMCSYSPKIAIIGRPTLGVNDYSNLAIMKWHDLFELYYPTSRLNQIDKREDRMATSVQPDIYITWTPEHIDRDVDMGKARWSYFRELKSDDNKEVKKGEGALC